jgi:hypothetical protein
LAQIQIPGYSCGMKKTMIRTFLLWGMLLGGFSSWVMGQEITPAPTLPSSLDDQGKSPEQNKTHPVNQGLVLSGGQLMSTYPISRYNALKLVGAPVGDGKNPRNFIDFLRTYARPSQITTVYRGVSAAGAGFVPAFTTAYYVRQILKDQFELEQEDPNHVGAGEIEKQLDLTHDMLVESAAGMSGAMVGCPFDNASMLKNTHYPKGRYSDIVKHIYKQEGARGFFKSLNASVCRGSAVMFSLFTVPPLVETGLYNLVQNLKGAHDPQQESLDSLGEIEGEVMELVDNEMLDDLDDDDEDEAGIPVGYTVGAGMVGGLIGAASSHPFNRVRLGLLNRRQPAPNFRCAARQIYREGGHRGLKGVGNFFRGLPMRSVDFMLGATVLFVMKKKFYPE